MFLNEPQSTHRYYGELLSSYRNRIFSESHSPMPYYVSGLALARVERLFVDGVVPRSWKPRKFQMLMVYRLQNELTELPALNSKAVDNYCDSLLAKLDDEHEAIKGLRRAGELVAAVLGKIQERQPERTRAFTSALMQEAKRTDAPGGTIAKISGTVKWFSDVRGYGFINSDDGGEIFVHYTGIVGLGYRYLNEGQRVEFALAQGWQGLQAVNVEVVES